MVCGFCLMHINTHNRGRGFYLLVLAVTMRGLGSIHSCRPFGHVGITVFFQRATQAHWRGARETAIRSMAAEGLRWRLFRRALTRWHGLDTESYGARDDTRSNIYLLGSGGGPKGFLVESLRGALGEVRDMSLQTQCICMHHYGSPNTVHVER
jgi:hypothetical protein